MVVDLLTSLFNRVGLQTNTTKTKVMTFVPQARSGSPSWRRITYRAQMDEDFRSKGKGRKVECSECVKMLAVGSLAGHLANQHNVCQSFMLEEDGNGCWNNNH